MRMNKQSIFKLNFSKGFRNDQQYGLSRGQLEFRPDVEALMEELKRFKHELNEMAKDKLILKTQIRAQEAQIVNLGGKVISSCRSSSIYKFVAIANSS
jgi:hypothetical protein